MRKISSDRITEAISKMCIEINYSMDKKIINALKKSLQTESSPLAKKIFSQMFLNAKIASEKNIPLCQDTGATVVFIEIGQNVHITGELLEIAINNGVRNGYRDGFLRKSIVGNPLPGNRVNTNDNTPAMIYIEIVRGDKIRIKLGAKGAGSENKSAIKMFNPTASWENIENFILGTIKEAGSNPCPPVIAGIGIGGTFEKSALLAKKACLRNIGEKNKDKKIAELEKNLLKKINSLNIGPLGFGGKTSALAVNIETYPCHIASLPVAVNLNCFTYRHAEIVI